MRVASTGAALGDFRSLLFRACSLAAVLKNPDDSTDDPSIDVQVMSNNWMMNKIMKKEGREPTEFRDVPLLYGYSQDLVNNDTTQLDLLWNDPIQ